MKTSSLLRYPGGKAALAGLLSDIRRLNSIGDRAIVEPFGGGAGASLTMLFHEEVPEVFINDADRSIYEFWSAAINRSKLFIELIMKTRVNIAEWRRQREIYRSNGRISRVRKGFATFYLNRCNRSGIIMNGGPIGGIDQKGKWKIDARFNKRTLRQRCEKLAEYKDRIHISDFDGIEFIQQHKPKDVFFFIDPPYFKKGKTLYLNSLDESYHTKLASMLNELSDAAWVLTYDDCPKIRKMYRGWATIRPFSLRYAASERRRGKEILIVPNWMRLPVSQSSAAIIW